MRELLPLPASLVAASFAVAAWLALATVPCPDMEWLMLSVSRMQGGVVLYDEIWESNPPLILWLYGPAARMAALAGWNPVVTVKFFSLAAVALSLALCVAVLRRAERWHDPARRQAMLAGIAGVLLLAADAFIVLAQREHLMVACVLPYLLLHLPSSRPSGFSGAFRLAVGTLAGLGFCLKPHFFLLWLARLGWDAWRGRSWRVLGMADAAILGVTVAYLMAVVFFVPQSFAWLRVLLHIYLLYQPPGETMADVWAWYGGVALAAAAAVWCLRPASPPGADEKAGRWPADAAYLGCIAAAAYAQALLQFKTWQYMAYPFLAFGALALMALALQRPVREFLAFAVFALIFFPVTPFTDNRQEAARRGNAEASRLLAAAPDGARAYMMNFFFAPAGFYGAFANLEWHARFPSMYFVLQRLYEPSPHSGFPTLRPRRDVPETVLVLERKMYQGIAEDVEELRPAALVTYQVRLREDDAPQMRFDVDRWLRRDAGVASLLERYRAAGTVDLCESPAMFCELTLYLTKEAPAAAH